MRFTTLESRLITDFGADSLDFIDIIFGLEKKFGIKMRDGELDFLSRLDFWSPELMREGYLTEATLHQLESWLRELHQVPDRTKVTPAKADKRFKGPVASIVKPSSIT